ncbi:hypothetical protein [Thermococcus sp. 5-4]|uniref:hypothetical protein n=1 Tax=Thermococcus sp. 5-4 TaxID=2008440 RepID=UPI000B49A850|nr:hypothetical protein [Thermococcus sp. 5-4]ASA77007.1 hypothetical protein CDI07_01415 [Thermococcus sp. 5-4]
MNFRESGEEVPVLVYKVGGMVLSILGIAVAIGILLSTANVENLGDLPIVAPFLVILPVVLLLSGAHDALALIEEFIRQIKGDDFKRR